MTRYERVMEGAAVWIAFYRANPHRFAKDYLHLNLHLFQKILIIMMNWSSTTVFIGSRGIGKSFLSAVFCVIRCILYPGTKICIASGTRGQSINVLEKIILELKPNSPELAAEIDEKQTKINGTNAQIVFKNSSYIKVVTASDSARGNRANLLLLDEFRMIAKDVIDTILRKFLTQKRMPRYEELTKEERKAEYAKEKNAVAVVKGLRAVSDFEYEFQMALTNKKLNPNLETLFLTTSAENMYLSSSMVKQIASMGGDISDFVPEVIRQDIINRIKK